MTESELELRPDCIKAFGCKRPACGDLPLSILQDFKTALDAACLIPLYYKRGTGHRHNNKVPPWGSEIAKKRQMVSFWMPKPIPKKRVPAVPWVLTLSDVQILLGSWGSMPSLFAISQLIAYSSEAFHSFCLMLLGLLKALQLWKPKSPGLGLSEAVCPLNYILHVAVPLLFAKEGHHSTTQKGNELRTHWDTGQQPPHVAHPQSHFSLSHQPQNLSLSGQKFVLISLGDTASSCGKTRCHVHGVALFLGILTWKYSTLGGLPCRPEQSLFPERQLCCPAVVSQESMLYNHRGFFHFERV